MISGIIMGIMATLSKAPLVRKLREAVPTAARVPITAAPATDMTATSRLLSSGSVYSDEEKREIYQSSVKPPQAAVDLEALKE